MTIFSIDAESEHFVGKLRCDLCNERIDIMCIDRNAALNGQMVYRCHPCQTRMKKNTQNGLNNAHVAPSIGMRHPLQPLAFKDFSVHHPNGGHARKPGYDESFV